MEFSVNENCIHCGKCIKDCMGKALKFNENKIPVLDETKCIKCQFSAKTRKSLKFQEKTLTRTKF